MLGFLITIGLAALIVIFTVFAAIIIRQAAVVALIILAPIAFALAILPNTKVWFDRWRKTFIGVLLLYPTLSLVFGVCAIGASIFGNLSNQGEGSVFYGLAAVAVSIIPLIAAYPIMKGSFKAIDGLTGGAGSKLSGGLGKAGAYGRKKAKIAGDSFNAGTDKVRRFAGRHYNNTNLSKTKFGKGLGKVGNVVGKSISGDGIVSGHLGGRASIRRGYQANYDRSKAWKENSSEGLDKFVGGFKNKQEALQDKDAMEIATSNMAMLTNEEKWDRMEKGQASTEEIRAIMADKSFTATTDNFGDNDRLMKILSNQSGGKNDVKGQAAKNAIGAVMQGNKKKIFSGGDIGKATDGDYKDKSTGINPYANLTNDGIKKLHADAANGMAQQDIVDAKSGFYDYLKKDYTDSGGNFDEGAMGANLQKFAANVRDLDTDSVNKSRDDQIKILHNEMASSIANLSPISAQSQQLDPATFAKSMSQESIADRIRGGDSSLTSAQLNQGAQKLDPNNPDDMKALTDAVNNLNKKP